MKTQLMLCVLAFSSVANAGDLVPSAKAIPVGDGSTYQVQSNSLLGVNSSQVSPKPPVPVQMQAATVQVAPAAKKAQGISNATNSGVSGYYLEEVNQATATPVQNANTLYENVVKPIAAQYGLPPELIAAIIQTRNPNWDTRFDEGGGKPGYGFGLGMVTLAAARVHTPESLFDPRYNVELMARILARGQAKHGKVINKLVQYYLFGSKPVVGSAQEAAIISQYKNLVYGK